MWATLCFGRLAGYSDDGDQGLDMVYLRLYSLHGI